MNKSLRFRLSALIIIAVIPALGYIFYTASEQRSRIETETRADTMRIAKLAAVDVGRLIDASHQILIGLSELLEVRNYNVAACNAYFSAVKNRFPMFVNIAAVKPNGDVFCSAIPLHQKINILDRPYFQTTMQKKTFTSGEFQISRITQFPDINTAMPVLINRQQIAAVVYASIDLNWFKDQLSNIIIPEHARLVVLDRNLTVLYHYPSTEKWIGKNLSDTELTKASAAQEEGVAVAKSVDGITRIWAFTQVPGTDKGMSVRYGISREAVFADINQLLKKNLIVLLIIMCTALAVAWYGGDYFVMRRMRILTKATDDLAKGDLSIRVDTEDQRDEISQLGSSFNRMAEALEHHIEERKQSEEQYHILFEESKDAIFINTPEGRYLDVNPALVELYGYASKEEVLSLDIGRDIYVDPEERKVYAQLIKEKGFVKDYEQRLKRKDGKILTVLTTSTAVRNKQGDIVAYRGINRDITERKQAEEALRERNAWINSILEASPAAIYAVDKDGIVLSWNKGAERMFGWSVEEAVGRPLPLVPEEKLEEFRTIRSKTLRGETMLGIELLRRKKDGSPIHISVSAAPLYDSSGTVTGIITYVASDITRQKKMEAEHAALENQLRQSQKMEAIGTLTGGIAHDFNNILSAIISYGYVTLMKMPHDDPHRTNIEHIMESADRAAALIKSLLAFGRKQALDRKPIDLNTVLKKLEKFLARVIGEDIKVRMALGDTETTIFADAGQLEQVFMNLATNARDAMPQGGSFTIETAITELDNRYVTAHGYGKPGSYAMITVSDTGIGMNEATRMRIFDPFFTTKQTGKGTGLGLAMVYGIIKQHEGFINAYSEPGIGTTFRIYLPLSREAAVDEYRPTVSEETIGGTETILLAEDDVHVRKITIDVLEQMGYTVISANDGEEAVKRYLEHKDKIQLLLFDLIMPKKSGKEAYDEIKVIKPDIKGIFLTGYAADIIQQKGLLQDTLVVLHKPISPIDLLKKVRRVLSESMS